MPNNGKRKHTMWLRDGDWDYLTEVFRSSGLSTSLVVRSIISNYVDAKRAEENANLEDIEVDVNL